jgi:hypothetical protein
MEFRLYTMWCNTFDDIMIHMHDKAEVLWTLKT